MTQPVTLASGAVLLPVTTQIGVGEAQQSYATKATIQATGRTQSGAGAATIKIQVSNDKLAWLDAATIDLTLSDSAYASDGFAMEATWRWVRANVTDISGTNAWVIVNMGA